MKHDLDAINAAIALGDKVIPPIGCEVRIYDMFHKCEYVGCIVFNRQYSKYINYYLELRLRPRGDAYVHLGRADGDDDKLLEVLFIPEDAPLFEEWERY